MKNPAIIWILILGIFFLQTAQAIEATEGHGFPLTTTGNIASGQYSGVRILVNSNMSLTNITKSPITNANTAYIYNDSGTLVISKLFSGNIATFSHGEINLTAGNSYRILASGSGWIHACLSSSPPLPIASQYISWTDGIFPSPNNLNNWAYFCNIESIGFSTEPPQVPPILTPIGSQNISENQTLTIQLHATDPNPNDNLTFLTNAQTMLSSPSFLNSTSGQFTYRPDFNEQGTYNVNFYVTDGQFIDYETVTIQVVDVSFATISIGGSSTIGNSLILNLNDPQNANKPYVLSASFGSSPGIPLADGRIVPLNDDWLFNVVLYVSSLFGFSNSQGNLDSQGNAQVVWNIPNLPFFQNVQIHFSFVTLDHSSPGIRVIQSIAPAVNVTIQ